MTTNNRIASLLTASSSWAGVTIALVALADVLFYGEPLGWTLGLFLLLLLGGVLLQGGARAREPHALALSVVVVSSALSLANQPGPIAFAFATCALGVLAVSWQLSWTRDLAAWALRLRRFAARGALQLLRDVLPALRWLFRGHSRRWKALAPLATWAIPVLLSAVFVWLFSAANPVVELWLDAAWSRIDHLVEPLWSWLLEIEAARVLCWLAVGSLVWPFFRTAIAEPEAPAGAATSLSRLLQPDLVRRCLILFNLVFGIQTALDLVYLWGGSSLPDGMSYAEYAHRGAYPLVLTAVLAGMFALIGFQPGGSAERDARTRRLVLVWLGQNVLLMLATGWRLSLYIEAYSLTRLRVATLVWICLVAGGFISIAVRIAQSRSNGWLWHVNALSAAIALALASFLDVDGRIAWYNVRNCAEIQQVGPELDVRYLRSLGPESLPALAWLVEQGAAGKTRRPPYKRSSPTSIATPGTGGAGPGFGTRCARGSTLTPTPAEAESLASPRDSLGAGDANRDRGPGSLTT